MKYLWLLKINHHSIRGLCLVTTSIARVGCPLHILWVEAPDSISGPSTPVDGFQWVDTTTGSSTTGSSRRNSSDFT